MAGKAAVMNSPSAAERDQQQQTALIGNNYAAITFFRFFLLLFFWGKENVTLSLVVEEGKSRSLGVTVGKREARFRS